MATDHAEQSRQPPPTFTGTGGAACPIFPLSTSCHGVPVHTAQQILSFVEVMRFGASSSCKAVPAPRPFSTSSCIDVSGFCIALTSVSDDAIPTFDVDLTSSCIFCVCGVPAAPTSPAEAHLPGTSAVARRQSCPPHLFFLHWRHSLGQHLYRPPSFHSLTVGSEQVIHWSPLSCGVRQPPSCRVVTLRTPRQARTLHHDNATRLHRCHPV